MSSTFKNVWDAAAQEVAYAEKNNSAPSDKYILLMGGKSAVSFEIFVRFFSACGLLF